MLQEPDVLVAKVDGRPIPKVIDFGVALAAEPRLTDPARADAGAIVGTPACKSPEQADPSAQVIATRTDIYALGVILYELLAGSPPLGVEQLRHGPILEVLQKVREAEPPRPSTRVSAAEDLPSLAAHRAVEPPHLLARSLRGELGRTPRFAPPPVSRPTRTSPLLPPCTGPWACSTRARTTRPAAWPPKPPPG